MSFYDVDNRPIQIDDLGTSTMFKVASHFDKKIRYESEFLIQQRYQRLMRRFGEKTIDLFIQQAGTLGAELYHLWKDQVPLLKNEIILHKN